MTTIAKRQRLLFLDNIKVLFVILVIFQHTRVTYDGAGWWYYIETNPVDTFSELTFLILTSVGGLLQTALLGLFFLMGGYFTPKSYDRKGARSFWRERLRRLGIPLLLYVFLVNPIMYYGLAYLGIDPWNSIPALQGSLLDYYLTSFQSLERAIDFLTDTGPMWFLTVLLLLTAVYTLWRQTTRFDAVRQHIPEELPIPRNFFLLLGALGLGCITFLVRSVYPLDKHVLGIPLAQITQYLMMFSIGVIAFRYDWFAKMTRGHVRVWSVTIAATFVLFYLYGFLAVGLDGDFSAFMGGPNRHALVLALADSVICVALIFALIPVFYRKYNHQGTLMKNLSASAFHMYLTHPPILVLVSLLFASILLPPALKLAIVFPLAVILCYLVNHYVMRTRHLKLPTRVRQRPVKRS